MTLSIALSDQPLPETSSSLAALALPVGLDVGNAATKVVLPTGSIRLPSYIQPLHTALHQLPAHGYVRYLAGNAAEHHGKAWLTGDVAYQCNPEAYLRVADDKQGKLHHALPLVLGALSYRPFQPVWQLQIVASIHHAREMGAALKAALDGTHTVHFNDNKKPSHVSITVLKVLDEGAGAIAVAGLTTGQNLLYDIGGGTTIISVFGERGRLINRQVSPGGVNALIDAMAKNPATIRAEAGEADREMIRRGLEAGHFRYGLRQGWDMRPVYEQELRPWIATVLRTALKAGDKWHRHAARVLAIGGGAQLPLVADVLRHQGIEPLQRSAWSNAKGLQRIATLLKEEAACASA